MNGIKTYYTKHTFWHPVKKSNTIVLSDNYLTYNGRHPFGFELIDILTTGASGSITSMSFNNINSKYYQVGDTIPIVQSISGGTGATLRITGVGTAGNATAFFLNSAGTGYTAGPGLYLANTTDGMGISTTGVSVGKWYWELQVISISSSHEKLGITSYVPSSNNIFNPGYTYSSIGLFSNNWFITSNLSGITTTGSTPISLTAGDTVGLGLDLYTNNLNIYKNGAIVSGSPIALPSSTTWYASAAAAGIIKANFGQTTFSYSVPSGFHAGLFRAVYSRLDSFLLSKIPFGSFGILSNNNLTVSINKSLNTGDIWILGSLGKSSGKWYWEITIAGGSVSNSWVVGISGQTVSGFPSYNDNNWIYISNSTRMHGAVFTSYGSSYTVGDIIGVALDMDNGTVEMSKNGTTYGTMHSGLTGTKYPYFSNYVSTSGIYDGPKYTCNFGQSSFSYTPPAGFQPGLLL